jgi:hypothetical protein
MMNRPADLTNDELLGAVERLAVSERTTTAELVAHLVELESRQLHVAAGFKSLFLYCHRALGLPEDATCNRTTAVRMVRAFPPVLGMLEDGRLNLSTLRLLAPYLTAANHDVLLAEAFHKSKREVEELIARRFPRAVTTSVRKLPERRPGAAHAANAAPATRAETTPPGVSGDGEAASAASRDSAKVAGSIPDVEEQGPRVVPRSPQPAVKPMAEDVFLIKLAAKRAMVDRLRYAQDLLGHAVPRGDITEVFDRALVTLIADLEKRKFGAPRPARPEGPAAAGGTAAVGAVGGQRPGDRRSAKGDLRSRYLPVEVRRAVGARDGGRCAYVAAGGRRCAATRFLEFHHLRPYAAGGEATVGNIALRCRAHNQYEADVYFGPIREAMSERDSIRPGADGQGVPAPLFG